ncbi:PA2169 family four-helix-bundle protein [Comamonadaceae bacterium OTU4NAUVB1]|nr:PA2169 family four-helix-bundle protein [Comamonadaceae bacterium OTU4NAUVB1]HSU24009.1 PA2169 family four-helix-bundle protein [Variovorax sp.]
MAIQNDSSRDINAGNTGDLNRDPITGAPGAHPVGTGVGATGGALAGAAAGSLAGPVGTVVGLVAGAVVGGLGGKAVAENVNPTAEDAYWRESYNREAYVQPGSSYDDYGPAYEMGWSTRASRADTFDAVEPSLADEWSTRRGASGLDWEQARPATRAAWERADRTYFSASDAELDGTVNNARASTTLGAASALGAGAATTTAFGAGDTFDGTGEPLANDEVVDVLNDLIENSRDGAEGFKVSAEQVETARLKQLFSERATACAAAAAELVPLVTQYGGTPADGGTAGGALHRGWVKIKGAVGADSEESILEEVERGEDASLARYRKALKNQLPADVRAVVQKQADGAQRNHDEIKALRDQARARG